MDQPNATPVSADQQQEICLVLRSGGDRETAVRFVGCTLADLRAAMAREPAFATDVLRAEAAAELTHLRHLQEAAQDKKNWRISAWWLERCAPERYRRQPDALTAQQIEAFVHELAQAIAEDVRDHDDRARLLYRLRRALARLQIGPRADNASPDDESRPT